MVQVKICFRKNTNKITRFRKMIEKWIKMACPSSDASGACCTLPGTLHRWQLQSLQCSSRWWRRCRLPQRMCEAEASPPNLHRSQEGLRENRRVGHGHGTALRKLLARASSCIELHRVVMYDDRVIDCDNCSTIVMPCHVLSQVVISGSLY